MKSVTITTLLALILAIPFFMRKRGLALEAVRSKKLPRDNEENLRYDIDDFLT